MKSCFRFSRMVLLFLLITPVLFAQQQPEEDIILKAMQDELRRNMTELALPNFDKPFFIMYGVKDQKSYSVSAILGSLGQSTETSNRFKTTTRVLVGDYSFNDESLEDNLFSPPTAIEISMPLDNDYYGIRRSLWSSTDKVYRDAARHFAKHKETLKETGKNLSDIPHRSFAKSDPVKLLSSLKPNSFDRAAWEDKARRLSALFSDHPVIQNSAVVIQYSEGHNYMVSSEGTVVRVPYSHVTFMALGQTKNEEGEFTMDQISHHAISPDRLPAEQQLAEEIKQMIAAIEKNANSPKFEEEYTGPVLLTGPSVAGIFSSVLFAGEESLIARNNIAPLKGFQFNHELKPMDGKIGKAVLHESVTVKVKPKLKSFDGTDLLGSFEVDDEGIIPPDELVVVERGILKTILNDRTITQPSQTANGFSAGPGVFEVSIAQKNSAETLKEKLIEQAKKEGLDYAIIVRDPSGFGIGLLNVYRVSVADGKEELLQNAMMNQSNLKTLKRILGASENYKAYNISPAFIDGGFNSGSALMSAIVPEAVLIEEMQIMPFSMPSLKEEEYVSNPLK